MNAKSSLAGHLDLVLSLAIALTGIWIFYPGAMSGDSVGQWKQVLHPEEIGTWFPPMMVYLWIALNKITHGPQGVLVFHYLTYHASILLMARVLFERKRHRVAHVAFMGMFPPLFFLNGVIWKDSSMMASMSMAIALLLKFESSRKFRFLVLSAIFLFYGTGTRHNALVCIFPYALYVMSVFWKIDSMKKMAASSVLAIAVMLTFSKAVIFANNFHVKKENIVHNMENGAFIWDLWGMSIDLGRNIIPKSMENPSIGPLTIDQMKEIYLPYTATMLWSWHLHPNRWNKSFDDRQFKKDFLRLVVKHPLAYLKSRGRMLMYMLGVKKPVIVAFCFWIHRSEDKRDPLHGYSDGIDFAHKNALGAAENAAAFMVNHTPLYLVWFYFVLMGLQIAFMASFKNIMAEHRKKFLLFISMGMTYWLPYAIISPSADFRYSNLTIYCSIAMLPVFLRCLLPQLKVGMGKLHLALLSFGRKQLARSASNS